MRAARGPAPLEASPAKCVIQRERDTVRLDSLTAKRKSVVGSACEHVAGMEFEPTDPNLIGGRVEEGHEWLEVENRRSIEEIESVDRHSSRLHRDDASYGKSYWIRTPRRARRERPVLLVVQKCPDCRPPPQHLMEVGYDPEVRESVEVGEAPDVWPRDLDDRRAVHVRHRL
jgi:hypothetical protein